MNQTQSHFTLAEQTLAAWEQDRTLEPKVQNTFECHIFCLPLDPTDEEKQRFDEACDSVGLRALCLGLDFQDKGIVNVLQSTKYYKCDDVNTPVAMMLEDAKRLSAHFEIARLKLEAVAANPGVPQTDEQARAIPGDTYFEYHIKIKAPATPENDEILKALASQLTDELGVKIPFSCNNMHGKDQRFLNARTYNMGFERSNALVDKIVEAIEAKGFEVSKVIREFIVFDTNKALDKGWLEF